MKKKIIIVISILVFIIALGFIPFPRGGIDDGGTSITTAFFYTIVKWRRFYYDPVTNEYKKYVKDCVYWFPDNRRSYEELWTLETGLVEEMDEPEEEE